MTTIKIRVFAFCETLNRIKYHKGIATKHIFNMIQDEFPNLSRGHVKNCIASWKKEQCKNTAYTIMGIDRDSNKIIRQEGNTMINEELPLKFDDKKLKAIFSQGWSPLNEIIRKLKLKAKRRKRKLSKCRADEDKP